MERVTFNLFNHRSGIVGKNFDNHMKYNATPYYTVPLVEILEQNNVPTVIDYFSLDVEGAESYVMDDFPFDRYTFKILTVERPKPDLEANLKQNGYHFLRTISFFGETLWVHESYMDSLDLASLERFASY